MKVPVLICGFNRPDHLRHIFAAVRRAEPEELFLALDFPRVGRSDDVPGWEACKSIFDGVDWKCDVHRNYAEFNMGCRRRMSSAISWALEHVDRLIICEDDCVPETSFFNYAGELLDRYENDDRIGGVCGFIEHYDFCKRLAINDADYYFDRLNTCWCWATWRRAWKQYDTDFEKWPEWKENRIFRKICQNRFQEKRLEKIAQDVYDGRISSWATIWWISCLAHDVLFAHPTRNMVTNVGFGKDSTHTKMESSPWANLPSFPAPYPIRHPVKVVLNRKTERYLLSRYYARTALRRAIDKIFRVLRRH